MGAPKLKEFLLSKNGESSIEGAIWFSIIFFLYFGLSAINFYILNKIEYLRIGLRHLLHGTF